MSMGHTRETPTPPQHVSLSLPAAVTTALESGTQLAEMNVARWADSFKCSVEDVMREFEKRQWIATQQPVGFEEGDDGK